MSTLANKISVGDDESMAYETKVILKMLVNHIAKADNLKEVYEFVADAASAEGLEIASYEEARKKYKHKGEHEQE